MGQITVDQARAICALYDTDYDAVQNRSIALRVQTILGIFFIGLALITLIGANWDTISRGARLSGLLLLTAAAHGASIWYYLNGKERWAIGLFMMGNFLYGASIILIAQIYHLSEHMPDGVFWWALGSLPFGLLMRSNLLTTFSGILALLWFCLELRTGFLNISVFSTVFPVFILAGLYIAIRVRAGTLLLLILFASTCIWVETVLALLWMDNAGRIVFSAEHAFVAISLLLFASSLSHWLDTLDSEKAKDYATLLSFWILRGALLILLAMSFEHYWDELLKAD